MQLEKYTQMDQHTQNAVYKDKVIQSAFDEIDALIAKYKIPKNALCYIDEEGRSNIDDLRGNKIMSPDGIRKIVAVIGNGDVEVQGIIGDESQKLKIYAKNRALINPKKGSIAHCDIKSRHSTWVHGNHDGEIVSGKGCKGQDQESGEGIVIEGTQNGSVRSIGNVIVNKDSNGKVYSHANVMVGGSANSDVSGFDIVVGYAPEPAKLYAGGVLDVKGRKLTENETSLIYNPLLASNNPISINRGENVTVLTKVPFPGEVIDVTPSGTGKADSLKISSPKGLTQQSPI